MADALMTDPKVLSYIKKRQAEGATMEEITAELQQDYQPPPQDPISALKSPPTGVPSSRAMAGWPDPLDVPSGKSVPLSQAWNRPFPSPIGPPAIEGQAQEPIDAIKALGDKITGSAPSSFGGGSAGDVRAFAHEDTPEGLAALGFPPRAPAAPPAPDFASGFPSRGQLMTAGPKTQEPAPAPVHPMDQLTQKPDMTGMERAEKLKFFKGIGQNLDLIGRSMVGLTGKVHPYDLKPMGTEAIDESIAMEEDKLSPQELQMASDAFGVEMPKDMLFSRLKGLAPALAQSIRSKEAVQGRMDLKQMTIDEQRRTRALMNDKDVGEITKLDQAIDLVKVIQAEQPQFDTGPLASAWHSTFAALGAGDPKKVAFKARIVHEFNQRLHDLTGAAVSPGEVARLQKEMPTMSDNDEQFKAKLAVVLDGLQKNREIFLRNKGLQGKNTSEFEKPMGEPGGTTHFSDGGTDYDIPVGQEAEFQRDHPNAVRG